MEGKRSIVGASVGEDGDGNVVMEFLCDCGTASQVTAVGAGGGQGPGTVEFAFTCGGCGTSHWPKLQRVNVNPDGSEEVAP